MVVKIDDVKNIVIEAGKIIEKYFALEITINYKLDESPVTIADFETNEYLKENLMKLFPEAGWLSEEDKDNTDRLSMEYIWIVDPLDGTKDFSEKRPEVAISVALVKDNQPVLGAVYNPITKEGGITSIWEETIFWGFEPNTKSDVKLSEAKTVVSRSEYSSGKLAKFENIDIRPLGSVANKLMRVAGGADDFYFSIYPKSEWDIAGGIALLNSVGKKYQTFNQTPVKFNQPKTKIPSGTLAGTQDLINEFREKYQEQLKDFL